MDNNWQEMFLQDLQNQQTATVPKPIGLFENIQRGGWSGFFDRATFGIKPMVEAGALYNATKRFQLDDYPRTDKGWNRRQEDKQQIVDYLEEQAEIAERGLNIRAKVGTVVFDMLPFMAEFIATGGLASLGKAGAKKSILKLAGKYASGRTAKIAAGVGGLLTSAGIRTALTPQHIAEGYYRNRLPEMGINIDTPVIGDTRQTPATSLYRAVGDHFIELVSEESGAGISKVFGAMAKGIMPKGVKASASKMVNALRKSWIKAKPGRNSLEFAKRIGEKAGFHGILEEMGEERLGDILRATFNIEDFGAEDGDVFDRLVASIPDGEQLWVEALAFSVPAIGRASIAVGHELLADKSAVPEIQKDNEPLEQIEETPQQPEIVPQPQPELEPVPEQEQTPEEETEQPEEQTQQKYYYYDSDDDVFKLAPTSGKAKIKGFEDFDFFISQMPEGWRVYEAVSGLAVGGNFQNGKEAIEDATKKLNRQTPEEIKKLIDESVLEYGPTPLYPDYKPAVSEGQEATPESEVAPETVPEPDIISEPETVPEQQPPQEQIPETYETPAEDDLAEQDIPEETTQSPEQVSQFTEGQRVTYPDSKGNIITGIVTNTTEIDGQPFITIKADSEHEAVIAGGIPIGRKETVPANIVKAIETKQDKTESAFEPSATKTQEKQADKPEKKPESKPKKKKITDSLSPEKQKRLEELKKRFNDKLKNELRSGFDPEMLTITAEMAIIYIEGGARTFAQYAKTVLEDVGANFRPYLKSAYLAARNMPGMEDYRSEMDKADYVDDLTDEQVDEILNQQEETETEEPEQKPEAEKKQPAPNIIKKNHRIAKEDAIVPGGEITQLKANINAIKLLKELEEEDRNASPDEQKILAQYTGWGNLSQAFNEDLGEAMLEERSWRRNQNWEKKWGKYYIQLKELLTKKEHRAASASTTNAHYTERNIIESMWKIVERLGFKGGTVLEPGAGIGHFFGLMPENFIGDTKLIGIELDSISSRILEKLYPKVKIFGKGFEDVKLPPNSVDLVISNYPFAQQGPADADKRYGQPLNLHNYFFARSLDALRPGGLIVAVTTHNTMDSAMQQRKLLASKGNLIAAIRLPNNAFKSSAGTSVVTDIIILQKPESDSITGHDWTNIRKVETIDEKTASINEYFVENPDMMLGNPSMRGTMYRRKGDEFTLEPLDKPLEDSIAEAIEKLPQDIISDQQSDVDIENVIADPLKHKENSIVFDNGKLLFVKDGELVPLSKAMTGFKSAPAKKHAIAYIKLRDTYQKHLDNMLDQESTDDLVEQSRKKLNEVYDSYIIKYGYITKNRASTKKFAFDPGYYLIASLEETKNIIDPETSEDRKVIAKAAVFTQRTIEPVREPTHAENVTDALRISLCYKGKVDLSYMASLTSKEIKEVQKELLDKEIAFDDPATGLWETSEVYLSGNVRNKLKEAKIAAEADGHFDRHVKALENIQPKNVGIAKIDLKLGSAWIPQEIVQDFARDVFGSKSAIVQYIPNIDEWAISPSSFSDNAQNLQKFGTARMKGQDILLKTLNMSQIQVMDRYIEDGKVKYKLNQKETLAAQVMSDKLRAVFIKWINKLNDIGLRLQEVYNEYFNFYVSPKFNGDHLELPGASNVFKLRNYQKNVIWRMLQQRCGMIAHCVGSGKTLVMAATAMEMRRLGLAKKPLIVVQNATLEQFPAKFRAMYPNANILVATTKDLSKKNRKVFVSRIASGDYDAVIMAQSTFDRIPDDPQREQQYVEDQLEELRETLLEAENEDDKSPSVKAIERSIKSMERKLDKLIDERAEHKDDVLTFEQFGVDVLFIDEAHAYKKPPFSTKLAAIKGVENKSSQKAGGLFLKTRHIQEKAGGKGVILATGTPVTNTLGEAWHMLNIATPHLLEEFNVSTFDRFVAAFAHILPNVEMNAGQQWVQRQMLSKFANGPELIQLIHSGWDVLSREELAVELKKLGQKLPKLKGGKTETVAVPLSPMVRSFNDFLKAVYARYEKLEGKAKKIYSWVPVVTYNTAKSAALDIRLVHPEAKDDPGSKINTMVKRALSIYKKTSNINGAQLVFCDTFNHVNLDKLMKFMSGEMVEINIAENDNDGVVVNESMFIYKDIKRKFIKGGVPEHEIAIAREYKTHKARKELFDAVNAGKVRILIGHTKGIGVGVDVQERLYAIHHLDAPWLPADLEQRQGRLVRYGNAYDTVEELAYGMEGTIDAAIYSMIARKAKFIWQVLSGKFNKREFEDPAGALVLSAEEQMAFLAGDNRVMEKVRLENRLRTLRVEKDAHVDAVARSRESRFETEEEINRLVDETIPKQEKRLEVIGKLIDGENWTLDGKEVEQKELTKQINETIEKRSAKILEDTKKTITETFRPSGLGETPESNIAFKGNINGFDIEVSFGAFRVVAEDADGKHSFEWKTETLTVIELDNSRLYMGQARTGHGIITNIVDLLKRAERELKTSHNRIAYLRENIEEYDKLIGSPFEKEKELAEGEARLEEINRDLVTNGQSGDVHRAKIPKPQETKKPEKRKAVKAITKSGQKLIDTINQNTNKGPRTIVEYVNDLVSTKMIVGRSQTTNRHPAHYHPSYHIVRSKSGIWQLNFHEAGHALSALISDTASGWQKELASELIAFTKHPGSAASAKNAEEGFADVIRCYITNPQQIPKSLTKKVENLLKENAPDILDGIKDARSAYEQFRSRPILEQMQAIQNDRPAKKNLLDSLTDLAYRAMYSLLGGSVIIHRLMRSSFRMISGESKLSALDITGIGGLIKSKINKAYKSQLKLARAFRDEIRNTKADVTSAYQTMIHLKQEVQRAIYGIKKGKEGIRVYSTGKGFGELTENQLELLKQAGFKIPAEKVKHGNWIYLSDKSISTIKHNIGLENWQAFCLYGQYRAALERYHKKKQEYPGMTDGLAPAVLKKWVDEQTNKKWNKSFKDIQNYMDQLLLLSVLSGEHTVKEAIAIKLAWQDYWPLPRQVEDRNTKHSGGGVDPDSGVRAAYGSALPFKTLDEALETRTRMALDAYYTNRLMHSMIAFGNQIDSMKKIPFEIRKNASRIMLPLRLDTKLAAVMTDDEQGQIIADYLNKQLMKELGVSKSFLKMSGQSVEAEDVIITHPGRKLWRSAKPKAVHVVSVFNGGKRRYYQLTDPLLFDMLSRGNNPSKYFSWISKLMTSMIAPWRRALTQNIGFALANTLSRDPANAGFMGKDGAKSLIPYFYAGCGLINRLKGNNVNADAVSQSELLSKALDHTTKDAHQGIVGSFKEMLKEGIILTDYKELSLADKTAALPGQAMSTLMKPIDIFNWTTGGRWLSQTGEELPREGAYISAVKRGASPEAAQVDYDYVTGDFGGKPGNANIASMVKAAGFLNPALRIMWGQTQRLTDPDPTARAFNVGAKVPALMMWGAIGAAINYLIVNAINPDDDEKEATLEQMRERTDENRLAYMAIAGKIRLPFDYGLIGAACSYGWNSTEEWLLADPITAEKKAKALLGRARDLPGITDIINPYIKTGAELWLNHSFFYDDEIVPVWMEAAYPYNPELQTWPDMADIYTKIGKGFNVSPIKVRYAVRNIFTRQMDDAVKVAEKISGKQPYKEAADLPVVGRLIHRKATGWNSQSVRSLSELDLQYDALRSKLKNMEKQKVRGKEYVQLKRQIAKLKPIHNAMLHIEKIWKQIKIESAKAKPDRAKIDRLKQQMTRRAKMFLKKAA